MMENKTNPNLEEVTCYLKLPVYTRNGIFIGNVRNVILDMDEKRISSLLITNTNPDLVEGMVDVAVPYRWVNAIGDIIILSYFPPKVTTKKKKEEKKEEKNTSSDIDIVQ
ncbi:MAG: PRC-barrel domain-containing protein [Candidatus Thermoplasmatota archaeon]|jgi:sporulation protein YlmC with PRC-barrel domain|nr:PRC-barrel domain-containing protein [Candidatus Thermoplasmatota archaeon]